MKTYLVPFLLFFCSGQNFAQTEIVKNSVLSPTEVNTLLTDSVKRLLTINYPVFRVYGCQDNSGKFFVALTESQDTLTASGDTLSTCIKAVAFTQHTQGFKLLWKWSDEVSRPKEFIEGESAIWFWTRYSSFTDADHDNGIDPVVVYGTKGLNNTDDGRVVIVVFYKGKEYVIRHQNGVLDQDRSTRVDAEFYNLPVPLQEQVKQTIQKMIDDGRTIFPYGWQKAMQNRLVRFSEN